MQTINLRDEVKKALDGQWETFAQQHPHLASAIDTQLLAEQAADLLEDDPDYRAAMEEASAAGLAAQTVGGIVVKFVREFLRRLVG